MFLNLLACISPFRYHPWLFQSSHDSIINLQLLLLCNAIIIVLRVWKCNFRPFQEIMTADRPTDRPTKKNNGSTEPQRTDIKFQRGRFEPRNTLCQCHDLLFLAMPMALRSISGGSSLSRRRARHHLHAYHSSKIKPYYNTIFRPIL